MTEEKTLSREQVREVDRRAIEEYGIPGMVLMENASRGLTEAVGRLLAKSGGRRVAIVAGTGNNAGDGFALARHLHNAGYEPTVLIAGQESRISGDARTNLQIIRRMHLKVQILSQDDGGLEQLRAKLERVDLVVDALLGTGLSGEVRGFYRGVIEQINASNKEVLAVDIPSGLDCDTGVPLGLAVRAGLTVTFVGRKKGFDSPGAKTYTGQVVVAEIGAPRELVGRICGPGSE